MRLVDADRLKLVIDLMNDPKEGETVVDVVQKIIDEQPTIWPMFSGRTCGKTALNNYIGACQVMNNHGIDHMDLVETLNYVLNQYQKIIEELTGSKLTKLTYDAEYVIETVKERFERLHEAEHKEKGDEDAD